MPLDVGRVTHLADLMHRAEASNGTAIASNWLLSTDGTKAATWRPESAGGSVSYASNSNDVGNPSAAGASTLVSRADHVHRGVHLLTSNTSNTLYGDVNLSAGTGIALGVTAQTVTITNTGSAGGGGGSLTDYVSGASGTGQIIIPGMAGSADVRVAATNDDEFDTLDTTDPMTGWTTLGTPTTHDMNSTAKSHYYLKTNAAALALHGIYKAIPSMPFTVTVEMADYIIPGGNGRAQIALIETGPGKLLTHGFGNVGNPPGQIITDNWTSRTAYLSTATAALNAPGARYLRIVVTSSSAVQCSFSLDGHLFWNFGGSLNPGFTIAFVGIVGEGHTSGQAMELLSDWIRFT